MTSDFLAELNAAVQQRSLRARRNRHTGPRPRVRAPRTIAAPAGFTTMARGRRAWRPALR